MPRLFPNIGRSSRENTREGYTPYGAYDPPYDNYGYGFEGGEYEHSSQNPSAWRRILPRKSGGGSSRRQPAQIYNREPEEFHRSRSMRATVEDYPEEHRGVPGNPTDDTESFVELISRSTSPVPIVQRESSLTRLQHAFADHGTYDPTSQAASTVRGPGTPRYSPREMGGPVEMNMMHGSRHEPVVINNIPQEGIEPDVMHTSPYVRNRERTPAPYAHGERARTPRVDQEPLGYDRRGHGHRNMEVIPIPHREDGEYSQDEYPPVVVVVDHGRNGKDTYYVIPGGAPVVFEDEDGNELTRVGDFSGNYRPQRRPRPVIIQDAQGREIGRAGFDDAYSSDESRSDDDYYRRDEYGHRSRSVGRPSHVSRHASSRPYTDGGYEDRDYFNHKPRGSQSSRDSPHIVYLDSYSQRSSETSRSPRSDRYYEPSPKPYRQTSSNIIHLDHQGRHRSSGESRSSGSSRGASYRDRSYR